MMEPVLSFAEAFNPDEVSRGDLGWGGWLIDNLCSDELSHEARDLLTKVGANLLARDMSLQAFIGQLEPLGRDMMASSQDRVRLMNMMQSKGLTVNTAIVMGVEEGVIPMPPPKGGTLDEERRLLYVAMTRATDFCVLTYANRRTGATAFSGAASYGLRRRSPLIRDLAIGSWDDGAAFVEQMS